VDRAATLLQLGPLYRGVLPLVPLLKQLLLQGQQLQFCYQGIYSSNRCHKALGGLTPQQAIQRLLIAEWSGMKTYLAFNQPTLAQRLKRHDP
jgi:hypothetical protein